MNTKRLIILRHGEAEQIIKDTPQDFDRMLTQHGQNEVKLTGKRVVSLILPPALIIASAATRTHQTAEIFAEQVGSPPIKEEKNLFHARPNDWIPYIHNQSDTYNTLILVGHNPTVSELCERLIGRPVSLVTGSCMVFEGTGPWKDLGKDDWEEILLP